MTDFSQVTPLPRGYSGPAYMAYGDPINFGMGESQGPAIYSLTPFPGSSGVLDVSPGNGGGLYDFFNGATDFVGNGIREVSHAAQSVLTPDFWKMATTAAAAGIATYGVGSAAALGLGGTVGATSGASVGGVGGLSAGEAGLAGAAGGTVGGAVSGVPAAAQGNYGGMLSGALVGGVTGGVGGYLSGANQIANQAATPYTGMGSLDYGSGYNPTDYTNFNPSSGMTPSDWSNFNPAYGSAGYNPANTALDYSMPQEVSYLSTAKDLASEYGPDAAKMGLKLLTKGMMGDMLPAAIPSIAAQWQGLKGSVSSPQAAIASNFNPSSMGLSNSGWANINKPIPTNSGQELSQPTYPVYTLSEEEKKKKEEELKTKNYLAGMQNMPQEYLQSYLS